MFQLRLKLLDTSNAGRPFAVVEKGKLAKCFSGPKGSQLYLILQNFEEPLSRNVEVAS